MGILRTDKVSGLETPTAVTGSVYFDGTGDYLSIASSPDLQLGTTDFTVEAWINLEAVSGSHQQIVAAGNPESANSFVVQVREDGSNRLLDFRTDTRSITSTSSIPTNKWTHIAVTKQSNLVRLFVNGVLENSGTEAESLTTAITAIGYRPASSYGFAKGYISNLRILKGTAFYTSDFTVPVHALEVIGDTVLLCCNNSDSAGADGTGKTITVNNDAAASTVSPGLTRDFTSGTEFQGVTVFDTQGYFVPPSGTTAERFPDFGAIDAASARGVFGGGRTPSYLDTIDYITISTTGNAQDFGNLTQARGYIMSSSSRTRGVFNGGAVPGAVNTQDFITISSTGDAQNFGELQTARYGAGNCSSSTRGAFGGGNPGPSNVIEFITIATTGNTQDFGDLTQARVYIGGCSSSTRGVFGGGAPLPGVNTIDFITISSTGNASDFGDLTQGGSGVTGCSSRTRGVFAGGLSGSDPYTYHNVIDYITIAALGNATDFGDLSVGAYYAAGCSSSILGVFGGLSTSSGVYTNIIEYVTIASTGDAQDFGDLTTARSPAAAVSNGHGGLG